MKRLIAAALMINAIAAAPAAFAQDDDPYLWLEEVTGDKPIAWAKARNAETVSALEARPEFKALHERLLAVYNSRERIPEVAKIGGHYYNFWQDAANPRGVWRRTSLEEFRKKDPAWETVLDLGKLSEQENEKWVPKGFQCLAPKYERCLLSLSRGGADAVVIREFDIPSKSFVKGGFELPESKGGVAWSNLDTILISRDFGPGTLSASGYPRILKEWKRGTPVSEAKKIYEIGEKDMGVWPATVIERDRKYEMYARRIDTRAGEIYLRTGDQWTLIDVPRDADPQIANGMLYVRIRTDWTPAGTTYKQGMLVAMDLDKFLGGSRAFDVVYTPQPRASLQAYAATKSGVVLDVLDNVKSRLVEAKRTPTGWTHRDVAVPSAASIGVKAVEHDASDEYWMTVTSFTDPTTLYLAKSGTDARDKLKSLPAFFEAKGLKVTQNEATSKDGTKVPYFVVMREGAKLDGNNPTILYGYGGFEISMTPNYSGTIGTAWLEQGGVWVLANLRGGGEFGPQWNLTARREGRYKTHDDFIAVAEDLIARKITSPKKLGIMGGSQGGLLVGAAFTQRPDLFRAVVCSVPLLDMKRFNKLLAGASWMGEYGNPDDPKDWAFISQYSPYQKVSKDVKYPRILFTTSTRDDRVHPGHARKMVAKMKDQGHDVLYYEYMEGGHAAGTNPTQQAYTWALVYTYFLGELR
ncbi:S9 family peptidase [Betaproteobacteria bacterium GR16-43]|nr:S9 family peptidase [Betaproteobacteria bacterium GR16-43]